MTTDITAEDVLKAIRLLKEKTRLEIIEDTSLCILDPDQWRNEWRIVYDWKEDNDCVRVEPRHAADLLTMAILRRLATHGYYKLCYNSKFGGDSVALDAFGGTYLVYGKPLPELRAAVAALVQAEGGAQEAGGKR